MSRNELTKYWVVLQDARDTDSRGNFLVLHKFAGPFSDKSQAMQVLGNYNGELITKKLDRNLDDETRRVLRGLLYVLMSDEQIAEGVRRGIRFD
ncbi:MAG TPA: hypothetical protein VJ761_20885 [Ktedonobacteraceae bacterium]|nr:hypothetical protein [Ktedonobacteraceae bacterium]